MNQIIFIDVQLVLGMTTFTTCSLILEKIQTKASHALHEFILASSCLIHLRLKSYVKLNPLNSFFTLIWHGKLYKTAQELSSNFHGPVAHRYSS
jgi:hypothetical protein